ncbi:hypothetical protein LR68_02232 [Anoxybacillus sp. BCO1]|nr:hypothetical protein LR68_02232 [Anoxybacillus sp. BCO1]
MLDLGVGALLFDIGMTQIPSALWAKKGPLSPEERRIISHHTEFGFELLKKQNNISPSSLTVPYNIMNVLTGAVTRTKQPANTFTNSRALLRSQTCSMRSLHRAIIANNIRHTKRPNIYAQLATRCLITSSLKRF